MFGLDFGKNTFLGIDIGTSAIKMVELKVSSGKPVISNYGWMPLEEPLSRDGHNPSDFEAFFSKCLKKIISETSFKTKRAYVSIPAFGGLVTLIDFPEMAKEDMEQAIRFEAHKYIPTSLDEVVISWDIVGKKNVLKPEDPDKSSKEGSGSNTHKAPSKVRVLLVAASKNKVARYENIIKNAGLNLESIELESFSMVNSLVGNDPGNFVIVDIGSRICNIILVENGMIKVSRNIDAGGRDITKTIAKSMNIDDARAEALKVSSKDFFNKESYINFPSLGLISGETSRIIKSFNEEEGGKIDSIILSGGTANFYGLDKYFSGVFNQKVIVGNPFSRIQYDSKLEPIVKKRGVQFSVSIGLALRGVNDYLLKK